MGCQRRPKRAGFLRQPRAGGASHALCLSVGFLHLCTAWAQTVCPRLLQIDGLTGRGALARMVGLGWGLCGLRRASQPPHAQGNSLQLEPQDMVSPSSGTPPGLPTPAGAQCTVHSAHLPDCLPAGCCLDGQRAYSTAERLPLTGEGLVTRCEAQSPYITRALRHSQPLTPTIGLIVHWIAQHRCQGHCQGSILDWRARASQPTPANAPRL